MANQKTVKIVNIKRSSPDKQVEQTIYESLWLRKENGLREHGWLPKNDIKEIKVEEVIDGKGIDTITIEEETVEEVVETASESKAYEDMTLIELKEACDAKGISFHHASKENKLRSLLEA